MVVVSPSKSWLSGMRVRSFGHHHLQLHRDDGGVTKPRHCLGILAFEAARTMCRLVSLHRALSDAEVARLRSAMSSRGVAYLNSADQGVLLRLACAEMVEDLDAAAAAATRLSRLSATRSGAAWPLHRFDHVYANLKAGVGDVARLGLGSQPKDIEKKVKKMERYIVSTSALYVAMEGLAELETCESRQSGKWRQCTDAFDTLHKRISRQRDHVRQLREESLWGRPVNKVAELMARSVVSIFARICSVYGSFASDLPPVVLGRHGRIEFVPRCHSRFCSQQHHHVGRSALAGGGIYSSGPLERLTMHGNVFIRNSGPLLRPVHKETVTQNTTSWKERTLEPPPSTLGASGLALRYARVVTLVEDLARSPVMVADETREELYWMLPAGLRGAVTAKLRGHRRVDDGDSGAPSEELAGGWREAAEGILGWLGPMARDTVQWHGERGFEQRQLDTAPRVMLLQTMMFSDKEKAEAAIVELLVAFSCVCRYREGGEEDSGEESGVSWE